MPRRANIGQFFHGKCKTKGRGKIVMKIKRIGRERKICTSQNSAMTS